jgi:hypothetical protein
LETERALRLDRIVESTDSRRFLDERVIGERSPAIRSSSAWPTGW